MTGTVWSHRDVILVGLGIGVVLVAQTALIWWAIWRLDELANIRERISRLADGLALLTDTTETGLTTIARELQRQAKQQPSPRTSSRASVSKRVVAAARKGQDLAAIADQEALSESEVHLHLRLAQDAGADAGAEVRS